MKRLPPLPHKPYPTVEEYRILSQPKPGTWMVRLRRFAPEMPASIAWCDHEPGNAENLLSTGPILVANIGFEEVDPERLWNMVKRPIRYDDYRYFMARADWVREYAPEEPEANPRKPVNLTTLRAIGPDE